MLIATVSYGNRYSRRHSRRSLSYYDIPFGDSTSIPQEWDRVVRRVVKDIAEKYKVEAVIGVVELRAVDMSHREVRPPWRVDVTECEIS